MKDRGGCIILLFFVKAN